MCVKGRCVCVPGSGSVLRVFAAVCILFVCVSQFVAICVLRCFLRIFDAMNIAFHCFSTQSTISCYSYFFCSFLCC